MLVRRHKGRKEPMKELERSSQEVAKEEVIEELPKEEVKKHNKK